MQRNTVSSGIQQQRPPSSYNGGQRNGVIQQDMASMPMLGSSRNVRGSNSSRGGPHNTNGTSNGRLELQAIVTGNSDGKSDSKVVTTALLSSNEGRQSATSLTLNRVPSLSSKNQVTVVEINGDSCRIVQDENGKTTSGIPVTTAVTPAITASSPVFDSSFHCEECCRSCSCGETMSSADESAPEDGFDHHTMENGEILHISKTTISTQTSLTGSKMDFKTN